MYRRDAEVKILQTPAKKINMTKEHLLGNAQPYLELVGHRWGEGGGWLSHRIAGMIVINEFKAGV